MTFSWSTGRRVKTLEELIANPPPGNKFLSWVERRSSERTALTVAIIGLFFAALFGLLGVVVGVIQLLVSYWAWKYPVQAGELIHLRGLWPSDKCLPSDDESVY